MYKLFVTAGLIALNVSLALVLPLEAQEVQTQKDCAATIADAQSTIEKGRNVQVVIRSRNISEGYPDHPENRTYNYIFAMQGAATNSVTSSPQFMKIIATRVINNCNSVASVTFGEGGDVFFSVGLMPNGKIDFFECLDHDLSNKKLKWGQEYCVG